MNTEKYTLPSSTMFKHQQIFALLNEMAILLPVFLFIFTLRGFIKALVAKLMGDNTAEQEGFLTLNPLVHVDLFGLTVIIGVFFVIGGIFYSVIPRALLLIFLIILGVRWTNPVPVNENNFKNYRLGGFITTLSGALGNLIVAFIGVGLLKVTTLINAPQYVTVSLIQIFQTLIDLALFFGVLDLIPLPPFDGGRALRYLASDSLQHVFDWMESYALFIILGIFCLPVVSTIFFTTIQVCVLILKKLMFLVFF